MGNTPEPYVVFEHFGQVFLPSAANTLLGWEQKDGGEIRFSILDPKTLKKLSPEMSLGEIVDKITPQGYTTQEQRDFIKVQVAHDVADRYRRHAMPDKNNYHAASPGVDAFDRMFVNVNNERRSQGRSARYADRGCAETNLLGTYQRETGIEDAQFDNVFLESGRAEKQTSKKNIVTLKERDPGHIACLCGECRANWRNHTQRFTLMPTPMSNRPSDKRPPLQLIKVSSIEEANELIASPPKNTAIEIPHDLMYPLPPTQAVDINPDVLRQGQKYLTDDAMPVVPMEVPSTIISEATLLERQRKAYTMPDMSIPLLADTRVERGEPDWENINKHLLHLIKDTRECLVPTIEDGEYETEAIIVETTDGKFYDSRLPYDEERISSKISAYVTALSNMGNRKNVKNVYVIPYDEKRIKTDMAGQEGKNQITHALRMPDPSELGRILKNTADADDPTLYVLPPNNGTLSKEELKQLAIPVNIREAFGLDFINPKRANGYENGHSGHHGR